MSYWGDLIGTILNTFKIGLSNATTLDASGNSAARTITLPNASTTMVGHDATQTLSNKTFSGNVTPNTNDNAALGTASLSWSDVFLASGALLNYANGNVVVTHTSGVLTMGTGDLRISTAGTNAASVVTVGGTQTLTNKTLTSPVINLTSDANGDIYYRNSGALVRLPVGSNGKVLTVTSGLPAWETAGGGGGSLDLTGLPNLGAAPTGNDLLLINDSLAANAAKSLYVGHLVQAVGSASMPLIKMVVTQDSMNISSNAITASALIAIVSDGADTMLNTINGGTDGQLLIIKATGSFTIETSGNIRTEGNATLTMANGKQVMFFYLGTSWWQLAPECGT